jgi:hypothetical protein
MRIWIRNTACFLANLHTCQCGLGQGNLWFCDLHKFSDLRFADWHTSEMCRFALAELAQINEYIKESQSEMPSIRICKRL